MNQHLTEDKLIGYLFDLADDKAAEIKAHLDKCSDCSAMLHRLKNKFASLAVLNEEPNLHEELIRKTINTAVKAKPGNLKFTNFKYIAAAASVLIVTTLLVTIVRKDQPAYRSIPDLTLEKQVDSNISQPLLEKSVDRLPVFARLESEQIPEKPPFAPASAIELVTLPKTDSRQMTIYKSGDLTLIRERRKLTLKRGWNWLQFMWENTLIDPTSLSLEPLTDKDKIDVQQQVYPARLKDIARWLVRSEVQGQYDFEITYFTSGIHWQAFYMATLTPDETKLKLDGYVKVQNNSGEDYEDTQTRLIVGRVNLLDKISDLAKRQHPYGSPLPHIFDGFNDDSKQNYTRNERVPILTDKPALGEVFIHSDIDLVRKRIKKKGLSEYFLYTIEGTETIKNGWAKRLGSFAAEDIPAESLYKYNEELYGENPVKFLSFKNDRKHNLGQAPIPQGVIKVYRDLTQNHLSYQGRSEIKYIPVNEKVELNVGVSEKISVIPVLMNSKTHNYQYSKDGNISGWDETVTWQIEVNNTTQIPSKIEITRLLPTKYWNIDFNTEGIEYKKHDANHVRFKMTLNPKIKKKFEYIVTAYYGTRIESYNK